MTAAALVPSADYLGNGVTVAFPAQFRFLAGTLEVDLIAADGTVSRKALGADYSVTGGETDAGGAVLFLVPPASGVRVRIRRATARAQTTDYVTSDTFPAESHELALDRAMLIDQEQDQKITDTQTRALMVPDGDAAGNLPLAATRADRLLGFGAIGAAPTVSPFTMTQLATLVAAVYNVAFTALADLVLFLQAGVGAIARSVQDRLRDYVSAYDFLTSSQISAARAGAPADLTSPFTSAIAVGGMVNVPAGTVKLNGAASGAMSIRGAGALATKLKAAGTDCVLALGVDLSISRWIPRSISELTIDGNGKASDGITLRALANTQVSGAWKLTNVGFVNCKKAFNKPAGNIGNRLTSVAFVNSDYGYYAVSNASPVMHAGADKLFDVHAEGCALAGYYIDSSVVGTGATTFIGCYAEGNPGFGVFIKNYNSSYNPLVLQDFYWENNGTDNGATGSGGTITIGATVYSPCDARFENANFVIVRDSHVPRIQLVNSHLLIEACTADFDKSHYTLDTASTIVADKMNFDGGRHPMLVRSVVHALRPLGNFTQAFYAPPRWLKSIGEGTVLQAQSFAAGTASLAGTGTVNGTLVTDGRTFGSCNQFVLPASTTENYTAVTLTVNKWYVATLDFKHTAGNLAQLGLQLASGVGLAPLTELLKTGEWTTLAAIGLCDTPGTVALSLTNGAAGSQTVRIGALQIVEFATEAQAVAFYNNGIFAALT